MSKITTLAIALVMSIGLAGAANATQCRDAHGKFMKCPPPAHCRDIKTKKFAKCGKPGTEPVPFHH